MTILPLMAQDSLGNEVSGRSETTLRGIDDFVTGFLGYENKATNVLAAADADPESPLANIYAGFTWMFLEAAGAEERATVYLKRAQALRLKANTREQLMLDQLERWIAGDIPAVQRIGETIVDNFPRDLASVKLHQYFSFNRGDASVDVGIAQKAEARQPRQSASPRHAGLRLRADARPGQGRARSSSGARHQGTRNPGPSTPWRTSCSRPAESRKASRSSARRSRPGPISTASCTPTIGGIKRCSIFQLGDQQAVFDAYDHHVWGIEPTYSQDQVGAVSLLARMEIAGLDVGDRWQQLAEYLRPRAKDVIQPFLTLQYLYGLARADFAEAATLLAAVEDKAKSSDAFDRLVWRDVALPAARGVWPMPGPRLGTAARTHHCQAAHHRNRRQPRPARSLRPDPARCASQAGIGRSPDRCWRCGVSGIPTACRSTDAGRGQRAVTLCNAGPPPNEARAPATSSPTLPACASATPRIIASRPAPPCWSATGRSSPPST